MTLKKFKSVSFSEKLVYLSELERRDRWHMKACYLRHMTPKERLEYEIMKEVKEDAYAE